MTAQAPWRMVGRRILASLLALASAVACGHLRSAPRALYPGPALPEERVALLNGPIDSVDGADVSRLGSSFALLPGCHVVGLPARIGEGSVSGAWSVDIGRRFYAFHMRAGRSYAIEIHLRPGTDSVGTGTVGGVEVRAVEKDARGKTLQTIEPVHGQADIDACQASADNETP
ncbi:MAG: hypothetical protein JXP73_16680 [Deltaproteobacteria bacterium]|nr:hypothetical protein [Deltaproteobacteria bacterium]